MPKAPPNCLALTLFALIALLCVSFHLEAQTGDPASWNTRLSVNSLHTSATGWATLATPAAGYRFNRTFSVDAEVPIYFYRLSRSRAAKPPPDALLVTQRGELGDVVLSGHARFRPRLFAYGLTAAVSAPTGDETYGLTTGRVAFDISNRFQRTFGRLTPVLVIGGGDSGGLANPLVTKMSSSLGPIAHFRGGLAAKLTARWSFQADVIEEVPLGGQKIYTAKIAKGGAALVTSRDAAAHESLYTAFDAAIGRHTVFSSYYSRGLSAGSDIVSAGLSYFLRGAVQEEDLSLNDFFR